MNKQKKWFLGVGTVCVLAVGIYIFANEMNGDENLGLASKGEIPVSEVISEELALANEREFPVIEVDANIVYTVEKDQIGEYADLIVLGVPQEKFKDRKSVIKYFPKDENDKSDTPEAIEDFYSFVNFKIDAVYKNDGVKIGDEISIFERAALITDSEGEKIIKLEGYHELEADQKYVLFLKKSPKADYYHIVRTNDGQEKISSEQEVEQQVQEILKKHNVKN